MEQLIRDTRYALRVLSRNLNFTALAVIAIGFGIAACTLLFSVVNATLFQPLPYRDSSRLVMVWDNLVNLRMMEFPTSFGMFQDYRERSRSFEQLEAFIPTTATLQFGERADRVAALRVTAGFFPMLGTGVVAGRSFQPGEDKRDNDNTALISHGLWVRRLGSSPSAMGRALMIDNKAYTIAGVLEPSFRFRLAGGVAPEVVVPIPLEPDPEHRRGQLRLLGKLRAGTTVEQARTEMHALSRGLGSEYRGPKGEDAGYTVTVLPLRDQLFGGASKSLLLLFAATLALLAITCANVAHLFLEWRAKRDQEFSIRVWMGATKGRIWRQRVTESLVVSLAGGALALVIVWFGARLLYTQLPNALSALDGLTIDINVFLFALLLCFLTGLLFGMLPGSSRHSGLRVTREGIRPWLVVAQTSLSVVLLVTAMLLVRSLRRLEAVDPGFRKENILVGQLSLPATRFREQAQGKVYWDRVLEWAGRQPEFEGFALSSISPIGPGTGGDPFSIEGRDYQASGGTPQLCRYQIVSPGYFSLMKIPLLAGRFLLESDQNPQNSVAVISQTLAKAFWPNESPLGKRITLGAARPGSRWFTIVGIAGDVRNGGLDNQPLPHLYETLAQQPVRSVTVLLNSRMPATAMMAKIEERMAMFDREVPIYSVSTLEQRILRTLQQPRFRTTLFSGFGLLAFLLAAFGIYSVTAFRVAQRRREIGIRMALGATPGNIRQWVSAHALRPVLIGLGLGLGISLVLGKVLNSFLYEVSSRDVFSYVTTAVIFIAVAWLASVLPAQRVARQQPSITLRYE